MTKVSDERTPLKEETKFINNQFLIKKHIGNLPLNMLFTKTNAI
jgi:hypothetical protein